MAQAQLGASRIYLNFQVLTISFTHLAQFPWLRSAHRPRGSIHSGFLMDGRVALPPAHTQIQPSPSRLARNRTTCVMLCSSDPGACTPSIEVSRGTVLGPCKYSLNLNKACCLILTSRFDPRPEVPNLPIHRSALPCDSSRNRKRNLSYRPTVGEPVAFSARWSPLRQERGGSLTYLCQTARSRPSLSHLLPIIPRHAPTIRYSD